MEHGKLFKVCEDFFQLHFKFVEVDNASNAMRFRSGKVFGVYKSGELEPLRIAHVEGEKIPVDEQVAVSIIFDANNRIRGIVMH